MAKINLPFCLILFLLEINIIFAISPSSNFHNYSSEIVLSFRENDTILNSINLYEDEIKFVDFFIEGVLPNDVSYIEFKVSHEIILVVKDLHVCFHISGHFRFTLQRF